MVLVENGVLLKNHVSCNFMLKYYIAVLFRQFTTTLNQLFNLNRANQNSETFMPASFEHLNKSKQI